MTGRLGGAIQTQMYQKRRPCSKKLSLGLVLIWSFVSIAFLLGFRAAFFLSILNNGSNDGNSNSTAFSLNNNNPWMISLSIQNYQSDNNNNNNYFWIPDYEAEAETKRKQRQQAKNDDGTAMTKKDEEALEVSSTKATTATFKQQQSKHHPVRFENDDICHGCRYARFKQGNKEHTCHSLILWGMKQARLDPQNHTAYVEIAKQMARSQDPGKAQACRLCDPENCDEKQRAYLDLQSVAPPPLQSVVHFLKSIDEKRRFPPQALENETAFYEQKENQYPQRPVPLVEYNPTIVQLPLDIQQAYLKNAANSRLFSTTTAKKSAALPPFYLSAFRVTNQHVCLVEPTSKYLMHGQQWTLTTRRKRDYLGLALLDTNLKIIEEITVETKPLGDFEDPRIFVLHGGVYVGSFRYLHQLFFEFGNLPEDSVFANHPNKTRLPEIPDSAAQNNATSTMRVYTRTNDRLGSILYSIVKNLNYFVDAHNRTLLETMPLEGHMEIINLTRRAPQLGKNATIDPAIYLPRNASQVPQPSFATTDEYDLFRQQPWDMDPFYPERGSACCVPIIEPNSGRKLLLGISHTKTKFKYKNGNGDLHPNHFTSSFYAMEAEPPYAVVARTGRFCLGTARPAEYWTEQNGNHNDNPYYEHRAAHGKLWLLREYDCPTIHYVSGMVEKADDPSKVIIAYGVMDCFPQMDVVEKDYIIKMLFSPNDLIQD